ncbi:MAG: long-chain fatty acid--CoA ligase [bacterium]|nr:long-chain fatty acid--CoA ligase [bacterium]
MNLKTMLESSAGKSPGKKLLFFEDRSATYADFNAEANRLAHALMESLSVEKGDRVGILLRNRPEFLTALYAVWKCGAVVVCVNTFLKPDEICFVLNDCEVKALITEGMFVECLKPIRHRLQTLESVVLMDMEPPDESYYSSADFTKGRSSENPDVSISPEDDAVFVYTSGTTGIPKAAVLSHHNLISNVDSCQQHLSLTPNDRFLLVLPMFHSFCLTVNCILPVYCGGSIVMLESIRDFEKMLQAVIAHKPTVLAGMPQLYNVLVNAALPEAVRNAFTFRACVSGSAPLPEAVLKAFAAKFPCPLLEGYGLSETSPAAAINPLDGVRKVGSIGIAIANVEIKIFDENDNEVPVGEVGELVIRGPNVMKGYYKRPEETADVLRSGWLHTGDIGKVDEDGYFYILDRKKELIISKGMKVYPRQIEELLYAHPKVVDAAVVAKPHELHGEIPVAFISVKEGVEVSKAEFLEYLRPRVAPYKVPREVIFVKEFPRAPTGKILKKELRTMFS